MKKKIDRAFIDMDGVLVDFAKGVEKRFGPIRDKSNYSVHEWYNMDEYRFWKNIDVQSFWSSLVHTKEAYELINIVSCFFDEKRGINNIYICTKPYSVNSISGKLEWLVQFFGIHFSNYIFTTKKELLASQNTLLIDDNDETVDKFIESGGNAILFPRPWNRLSKLEGKAILFVKKSLVSLMES